MSGISESSVTYFDSNGDTRLLFNEGKPDEKTFVVSYKVMSLVSDSWACMLDPNGRFREATQEDPISLPDDDWRGFQIILNIAHLHFDRVPRKLTFSELLSVAVLTEKYCATKIVRPWFRGWLRDTRKHVHDPEFEEWLWIAWAFGQTKSFETLARTLVMNVATSPDGRLINSNGTVLSPDDTRRHFPPGILESISEVRQQVLNSLLETAYSPVEALKTAGDHGATLFRGATRHACDPMAYAPLYLELQRIGLKPGRKTAKEIPWSVMELVRRLQSISAREPYERWQFSGGVSNHYPGYVIRVGLRTFIGMDLSTLPDTAVLEPHRRHMRRKRKELYGMNTKGKRNGTLQQPAQGKDGVDRESEEEDLESEDEDEESDDES